MVSSGPGRGDPVASRIRAPRRPQATRTGPAAGGCPRQRAPCEELAAGASDGRKTTSEPLFGQIFEVRGFRRSMLRGLEKVNGEWDLVTLAHNLLKLWRSGEELPAAG